MRFFIALFLCIMFLSCGVYAQDDFFDQPPSGDFFNPSTTGQFTLPASTQTFMPPSGGFYTPSTTGQFTVPISSQPLVLEAIVQITNPQEGVSIEAGSNLALTANSFVSGGVTLQVTYIIDEGAVLGTALSPPYAVTWFNVPEGPHTITAVTTDNLGNATPSPAVTINAFRKRFH